MIERVWRGWIAPERAEEYQLFLRDEFLPSAHAIAGYRGARVMRRRVGDEIEFMTITRFDSIEAIRDFAGEELERAHVAAPARALLGRWDEKVAHYEIAFDDEVAPRKHAGLPAVAPARSEVKLRAASSGAVAVGTMATGSAALGALSLGALAVGAAAIGALAIGKLKIGKARIRRLEIDELVVGTIERSRAP